MARGLWLKPFLENVLTYEDTIKLNQNRENDKYSTCIHLINYRKYMEALLENHNLSQISDVDAIIFNVNLRRSWTRWKTFSVSISILQLISSISTKVNRDSV